MVRARRHVQTVKMLYWQAVAQARDDKGRKLPDLVECVAITLLERGLSGFFKQQYRLSNVPRFDLEEMRTVLESVERTAELRERKKCAAAATVIPTRFGNDEDRALGQALIDIGLLASMDALLSSPRAEVRTEASVAMEDLTQTCKYDQQIMEAPAVLTNFELGDIANSRDMYEVALHAMHVELDTEQLWHAIAEGMSTYAQQSSWTAVTDSQRAYAGMLRCQRRMQLVHQLHMRVRKPFCRLRAYRHSDKEHVRRTFTLMTVV
ncbi:hypothetical protein JKP88DRAFT_247897 [Tribonema minus]|uniref:Uncharacterized protein n=1 Tax=Tribonema minus TaxID=303371 RepID=A0A835YSG1_9STRA|nr:hypothetical protein JKP88DRAFT_247897 [Tribonema minus]